jgi:hypothetical protein
VRFVSAEKHVFISLAGSGLARDLAWDHFFTDSVTRALADYWALCRPDSTACAQRLADRLSGRLAVLAAGSGRRTGWRIDARLQELVRCEPDLRSSARAGSAAMQARAACLESRAGAFPPPCRLAGTPEPRDIHLSRNTGATVCPLPSRDWAVPGPAPTCCTPAFDENWIAAMLASDVPVTQEGLSKRFVRPPLAQGAHGHSRVVLPGLPARTRNARAWRDRLMLQGFAEWLLNAPWIVPPQMMTALDRLPDGPRFAPVLLAAPRRLGRHSKPDGDDLPARRQVTVACGDLRLAC